MKRYLKHLAVIALAIGISLMGAAANATNTTYTIGDLTSYTNVVLQPKSSTPFTDIYTFTLLTASEVIGDVFKLPPTGKNKNFNIKDLCLTFQNSSCVAGNLFDVNLAAGSYFFDVTGTAKGLKGGRYIVNVSALSPIPEPQTWAMMLGGLGLIGFMSFRRRNYS